MLARKPRMLVAVALANRMARIVWALMTKNDSYRCSTDAKAIAGWLASCGDAVGTTEGGQPAPPTDNKAL